MKEYLESLGITGPENLAARLLYAVWGALDWQSGMWKSAGPKVYELFESRVRQAARERTLADFLSRLCRRCHVAVPKLEEVDHVDLREAEAASVLSIVRNNSGLAVATLRLWLEQRREMRNPPNPQNSLFGGGAA